MFRRQIPLLALFLCLAASTASARRRPPAKTVPTFSINGRIEAEQAPPATDEERRIQFLRQLKDKAYHRFRDPLVILPPRLFLSSRLAVVVWNAPPPAPSDVPRSEAVHPLVIRGGAFIPPLFVLHFEDDFHVVNRDRKEVRLYSPGRFGDGKDEKPEKLASEVDRVIPMNPRGSETADPAVRFWSYPLRLVGFPSAVGRVLFVRSRCFTVADDDGSFTLPPLPAGKYQLSILDRDREIHTQEVVIPEKGKGELKPVEIKLTLPFSTEEF